MLRICPYLASPSLVAAVRFDLVEGVVRVACQAIWVVRKQIPVSHIGQAKVAAAQTICAWHPAAEKRAHRCAIQHMCISNTAGTRSYDYALINTLDNTISSPALGEREETNDDDRYHYEIQDPAGIVFGKYRRQTCVGLKRELFGTGQLEITAGSARKTR